MSKSKEPTRAQLSSRLTYQAQVPAFLRRLQQGSGGGRGGSDEEDDEFEEITYDELRLSLCPADPAHFAPVFGERPSIVLIGEIL